jgi:hypothetical protein
MHDFQPCECTNTCAVVQGRVYGWGMFYRISARPVVFKSSVSRCIFVYCSITEKEVLKLPVKAVGFVAFLFSSISSGFVYSVYS